MKTLCSFCLATHRTETTRLSPTVQRSPVFPLRRQAPQEPHPARGRFQREHVLHGGGAFSLSLSFSLSTFCCVSHDSRALTLTPLSRRRATRATRCSKPRSGKSASTSATGATTRSTGWYASPRAVSVGRLLTARMPSSVNTPSRKFPLDLIPSDATASPCQHAHGLVGGLPSQRPPRHQRIMPTALPPTYTLRVLRPTG